MAYDLDIIKVAEKGGAFKVAAGLTSDTALACRVYLRWELGDDGWFGPLRRLIEADDPIEELAELLGDDFRDAVEGEVLP